MTPRIPLFSVSLVSAAAIAYEIALMRLFAIIQWHHFAYMMISLALLGYGISGTLVAVFRNTLSRHVPRLYLLCLVMFSLGSVACFLLAQSIPFNAEALFWEQSQFLKLLIIYLLLCLPFLFVAAAICLLFIRYPSKISRIYSMDLIGAGCGGILVILLLTVAMPLQVLMLIGLIALTAVALAVFELYGKTTALQVFSLLLAAIFIMVTTGYSRLKLSEYKDLSQQLRIQGTQLLEEHSSPLGFLSVVENQRVPLRHTPGLSLNNKLEPLPQIGIFTDGANMSAVTRFPYADPGNEAHTLQSLAYLDQTTSALAYHFKPVERLLVLGAGGGSDILQGLFHQVESIDAVEINRQLIELMQDRFADFNGHLFQRDNVTIHQADIRDFITLSKAHFELIQLSLMDSFIASTTGLYALNESYLYTLEALSQYLQRLSPGGYLSISRWIKTPPRDGLKLLATAVAALDEAGFQDAAKRMVFIRSWQTSTLVIKQGVFGATEIDVLKRFCRERSFDIAWYPGITPAEVNYYNRFQLPYFYRAAVALLGDEADSFMRNYKYNLSPATDDKPFFHQFFKWSSLPEMLRLKDRGGLPLLETGYLVLLGTLLQAAAASLLLIIVPLRFIRHEENHQPLAKSRTRLFLFFFSIGLAFLFIEIAFMHKLVLFLHHPVYSITIVLSAFMIFAGIGSAWCQKLMQSYSRKRILKPAVIGIVSLAVIYNLVLSQIFSLLTEYSLLLKVFATLVLIAPLAVCMGMPFPLALSSISSHSPAYVPWAWGVNGCASVISAVLATLLAIHLGFSLVVVIAGVLYAFCYLVFPDGSE